VRKYGCECGSEKENLEAMKVAVVFARSGSVRLQGSSNTDFSETTEKVHS
jgi:hypothetical protein